MDGKGQPTMADEVMEMMSHDMDYVSEYVRLANHARRRGHWDRALDLCTEALSLCKDPDVSAQHCHGVATVCLGAIQHSRGVLDEAGHAYFEAESVFKLGEDHTDRWNEAVARYGHGLVELSKGDLSKSMRLLRESKNMFSSVSKEIPEAARQIRLVEARIAQVDDLKRKQSSGNKNPNTVPVIGYTSAGEPISAIPVDPDEATQNSLPLHGRMCGLRSLKDGTDPRPVVLDKNGKYFALVVAGDSMVEVGIHDGEYVIFRQQPSVDSGDIAVIRIDNSDGSTSLVKKFIRQGDKIILKAKNDLFIPKEQIFSRSDPTLEVLGKVIAVASQ